MRPLSSDLLIFLDRKSTRLNSSHSQISYAVFCLKKKKPLDFTSGYTLIGKFAAHHNTGALNGDQCRINLVVPPPHAICDFEHIDRSADFQSVQHALHNKHNPPHKDE